MTAARKLFLSSLIVAAGFGVAWLLGEPASRWYAPQSAAAPVDEPLAAVVPPPVNETSAVPPTGRVRLVPEFAASNSYGIENTPLAEAPPPLLPVPARVDDSASTQAAVVANGSPMIAAGNEPRARLRDEAPRPLVNEPRPPAMHESSPPLFEPPVAHSVSFDAPIAGTPGQATIELPPWPSQNEVNFGGAIGQATIGPPPLPSNDKSEIGEPRSHIVVDGDSLERLAARYLDDPQRAGEIYQANRELLTSPDLLPIGAELKIPSRTTAPTIGSGPPLSFVPREVAVHTSPLTHNGFVPVRPIPSAGDIRPQAQLVRPLPVE